MPHAPVNTPADLYEDPYLKNHKSRLLPVTADGKTVRLPTLPIESNNYEFSVRRQPPKVGEHTKELLKELGVSGAEIDRLIENKIVVAAG